MKGYFFIFKRGWQIKPWNPKKKLMLHYEIKGKEVKEYTTKREGWFK